MLHGADRLHRCRVRDHDEIASVIGNDVSPRFRKDNGFSRAPAYRGNQRTLMRSHKKEKGPGVTTGALVVSAGWNQ
jgi:hypothetical protein